MSESILVVGYEINAQLAKDKLQKSKGLMSRLKKTHSSEVVSHVTNAWNELESILKSAGHHCENKVLYTAQLSAFSEVKSNATTIVNNSFLLSIITADEDSKFEAVKNERYVAYSKASEFEQNQFSIYLSEIESNFESQEVGVFGWLQIPTDDLAKIQKRVASSFPTNTGGELHFFEFHNDGSIFPNFADVETQRFEGKLAGNYALKFDAKSCQRGIADLNEISVRLFNVKAVEFGLPNQIERQHTEAASGQASVPAPKAKNKYSEEFKRQVAEASLAEGRTLKSVADEFGVSATLVRNWQIKFFQQDGKSEIESQPTNDSNKGHSSFDANEDDDDFERAEVEDSETAEGDIGLFEFQIKRGYVDEDEIDDEDVQNLAEELTQLCKGNKHEKAAELLLSNLSFEFGPDELDDDPERFFSSTDYIEFECSSENTSVKIGYDEGLVVTVTVQFEIPLNGDVSTGELVEYLPDSGAWAIANVSPGWGYTESDGENVWFLGIKGHHEKQNGNKKSNSSGNATDMTKTAKPSDEQLQELFEATEEALNDNATFATLVSDAGGNLYNVQLDVEFNEDGTWDFIARLICEAEVSLSDNAKETVEDKLEEIGDELYSDFEKCGLDPQMMGDYRVVVTTE